MSGDYFDSANSRGSAKCQFIKKQVKFLQQKIDSDSILGLGAILPADYKGLHSSVIIGICMYVDLLNQQNNLSPDLYSDGRPKVCVVYTSKYH